MGKRSRGEGTIVRRSDGRWAGAVSLQDGQRKWLYGKTQQEVAKKVAAVRRDRDGGLPIVGERRTVDDYLGSWLEMIKPGLRISTHESYAWVVAKHIVPHLGKQQLAKLSGEHVQRWLGLKLQSGLSGTSVRYFHTELHDALAEAVRLRLVQRNVCDDARKPRKQRNEMRVWTEEQASTVLCAVRGERFGALFALALSTGMREGEMFALRWRDLDLKAGSLHVQRTLKWHGGKMSLDEVKTEAGRRHISLAAQVVEALQRHRREQNAERLRLGAVWRDNDLVFCDTTGGAIRSSNFSKRVYVPLVTRAGVPRIRPHDMRHTAATIAILNGMPIKAVSEMLGHSSVAITMSIYAHVMPNTHREVAAAMGRILFSGGGR
jgi:integrase